MNVKEQCPQCAAKGLDTSGDNLHRYEDGSGHCFACEYHEFIRGDTVETTEKKESKKSPSLLHDYDFIGLTKRKINSSTCEKYGYGVGYYGKKKVQIANYTVDGEIVAQKIRDSKKKFKFLGEPYKLTSKNEGPNPKARR